MKKIGLALGSGGARGWAHLGVIQALQEAGIPIHGVAGVSMGALVGGAYASGKVAVLREVALRLDWKQVLYHFLEFTFPRSGLVDGAKVVRFVREQVAKSDIESLPVPFAAVATDLSTGREVVIRKGDLIDAIRASISLPGIFTPVIRGDEVLVDGGLINPVPVSVARQMGADVVIAVDLNRGAVDRRAKARPAAPARPAALSAGQNRFLRTLEEQIRHFDVRVLTPARRWMAAQADLPTVFDVLGNSIRIMEAQIAETRLKVDPPDVLIRPKVGRLNFMEFHRADEVIRAGYAATMAQMDAIRSFARHTGFPDLGKKMREFSRGWKKA